MSRSPLFSLLLLLTLSSGLFAEEEPDFVRTKGGTFVTGEEDRPVSVCGANCYFLLYAPKEQVEAVLQAAKTLNLTTIRAWGFLDGPPKDGITLHPEPGRFSEKGFERFDWLLWRAELHGLRLILPLVNHWKDFGGTPRYARWFDIDRDTFYSDARAKKEYRAVIRKVLLRKNRYKDGLAYRDDPTILAWELANEPRCPSDPSGDTLFEWVREMSTAIRTLDPHHLIGIGNEGFLRRPDASLLDWTENGSQGSDWNRTLALPSIDFGTLHLYPEHWGKSDDWALDWIRRHQKVARSLEKPLLLEEFGTKGPNRNATYRRWIGTLKPHRDGWLVWMLAHDDYPDYDGYRLKPKSKTALLLKRLAGEWRTGAR